MGDIMFPKQTFEYPSLTFKLWQSNEETNIFLYTFDNIVVFTTFASWCNSSLLFFPLLYSKNIQINVVVKLWKKSSKNTQATNDVTSNF